MSNNEKDSDSEPELPRNSESRGFSARYDDTRSPHERRLEKDADNQG